MMLSIVKSRQKLFVMISILFLLLSLPDISYAHYSPAYSHDSGVKTSNPKWMTYLRDDVLLSQLSIPGTHDTMSFYWGDAVQTQSMSLPNQLKSGVRVLDIRCSPREFYLPDVISMEALAIYHGIFYQFALFDDVLEDVIAFLGENPGETVLMRVKNEDDSDFDWFEELFQNYWKRNKNHIWQPTSADANPTLGDIRGKIVILQDFPTSLTYGITYNHETLFSIQDDYKLTTNWDLYDKWRKVKVHLGKANEGSPDTIYMNYLSGASGSFPYFVASGHSSPQTSAPRLWTGMNTYPSDHWTCYLPIGWALCPFSCENYTSDCWPDFPRIDIGLTDNIYYEGTNVLTYERLGTTYKDRVGIIMADFPGPGLIDRIIALNDRFNTRVTSDGGTVYSLDEAAWVYFPPDAIPDEVFVSIVMVDEASVPPPPTDGFQLLGEVYAFEAVDAEGNPVTEFDKMLTLTFQYNPDDLNGLDEDSLMIQYWDDTLSSPSWVDLPSIVDTAKHTVTAETDYFTVFGIFGIPEPGTFMLLGLGLLGLFAIVWRRRQRRK